MAGWGDQVESCGRKELTSGAKWVIVAHALRKGETDGEDGRKRAEVFLGDYFHTLDGKGRVVMPSSFRENLENGCVITKGQDGQLVIFSVEDFRRKAAEVMEQPQDKVGRRVSRTVFGGADMQTPDKSGRVLVKPELRQYAGLETTTELAVVGVFDHVELWDKDRYLAERASGDQVYLEEEH